MQKETCRHCGRTVGFQNGTLVTHKRKVGGKRWRKSDHVRCEGSRRPLES